jgi:hypothetical protein
VGKKNQLFYAGTTLGIMKDVRPLAITGTTTPVPQRYSYALPGSLENATSFDFPVQYWPLDISEDFLDGPITKTPHPDLLLRMIEAGKELESQGVKLISTACGFYAYFQGEVANALNVPFCSGSLMSVPLVSRIIGSNKRVGIIAANSRALTKKHLAGAGIDNSVKCAVIGYETYIEKREKEGISKRDAMSNLEMLEEDLVDAAKKLIAQYPDVGAIVLECTAFPPAAYAIWKATGLPVFDVVGLLNWIGKSVVRKKFHQNKL